jgi:hypothetical protein
VQSNPAISSAPKMRAARVVLAPFPTAR